MDADAGLRRDALGEVLRALTHDLHHAMTSALAGEIPRSSFRLDGCKVSLIMPLSAKDRRATGSLTGLFSSRLWSVTDPREAMELLHVRGLAPGDDERRGFVAMHCAEERAGKPCTCSRGSLDLVHVVCPATIPDLVAYASLSVPTIMRAEELARETVARLRTWGCPQPERVVWRVGPHLIREGLPPGWPLDANASEATGWDDDSREAEDRWNESIIELGGHFSVGAFWRAHTAAWKGDKPCPHAPVAALADMGLALDSITADAITLALPPVGSP